MNEIAYFSKYNLHTLKHLFPSKNKLLYSFSLEIFSSKFNRLFTVFFTSHRLKKLFSTDYLREATKCKSGGRQIETIRNIWLIFSIKLTVTSYVIAAIK